MSCFCGRGELSVRLQAQITREEGDAKLKKVRPWFGYFLIAWSLYGFVSDCFLYYS